VRRPCAEETGINDALATDAGNDNVTGADQGMIDEGMAEAGGQLSAQSAGEHARTSGDDKRGRGMFNEGMVEMGEPLSTSAGEQAPRMGDDIRAQPAPLRDPVVAGITSYQYRRMR